VIEYVDKDVQRLIHMISAIKRMNGILATIPLPSDFTLPEI